MEKDLKHEHARYRTVSVTEPINVTKIIGVAADVIRNAENDYVAGKCCLFGLSEEEYEALASVALLTPRNFSFEHCDRITARCSPWRAMRVLGEQFGYTYTVTPLDPVCLILRVMHRILG